MTIRGTYHGHLRGSEIGASILVTACEKLRIQPDAPGVRLRGFAFVGEPSTLDGWPDVEFDLAVDPASDPMVLARNGGCPPG